ncbi:sensor histidine kinase [Sphingomonas prati]|uniref:sensor histidine kinase n=1 Tax=Sphingomonas prati TaxID=1843237 RepID=UPI0012F65C9A|nr:PAS domain-containing sensor histidine kinase [Sphingomonas prati]GGE77108.1 two-component sensor histidine kinase [Sphingomonas prati]
MVTLSPAAVAGIATILAAWLVAAVVATLYGLRRAAAARGATAEAERLTLLLRDAPAIPLRVAADGRLDAPARLGDWLGLRKLPLYLVDLGGADEGLPLDEAVALAEDVRTAQRSARPFQRTLHPQGGKRVLVVRGRPAGTGRAGEILLWVFDDTDSRREIELLSAETERLGQAVAAISSLIEAAPFPMWHRGPDLRLALVNGAYVAAVEGRDGADVVTRGLELVEGQAGRGPLAAAAEARAQDRVLRRTVPATIAGARRMVRITDVPLGPGGVAGYAVDVEELEEARADLNRFARTQRDLLDRLSAGVAQFAADRSLVFYNHPFLRMFALQPEWLADRPEFDRVLDRMREAQRAPESRDFPRWRMERRGWFTAPDAVEENWLLPGGSHYRLLAQPLPDGGLLLIFEDRTEQLQLASARDTLLRVRTATFDNLFEAVGVFAADGRLHLWNNRFKDVWGLADVELAQSPRVDALVESVARRLANPSRAGLIRELVRIATIERQQRSGRVEFTDGRHFEFAAVPLPDGNALFTMLDITASRGIEAALRERAEALEQADLLKTAFVANMSYELRVPLTSISGFAEMLGGGYAGVLGDTAKDYVAAILSSVARLSALIENILDLTQSEAGSLPLAAETVDLGALVADGGKQARAAAKAVGLDLAVEIVPPLGTVTGDPRRLRQVIDHLLHNAVRFTPGGGSGGERGRVLFRATREGDTVEIVISDNGPGIARDRQAQLFDRFRTGAGTAAPRNGRDTPGPGLPLTRRLVEAHGGTIVLASEPGEGTTVIVRLPADPL